MTSHCQVSQQFIIMPKQGLQYKEISIAKAR